MQIVIDIPKEKYQTILNHTEEILSASSFIEPKYLYRAILNGTPLPKCHGDLKDISKLHHTRIRGITDYACGYNERTAEVERDIADLPTIIEADKLIESEE